MLAEMDKVAREQNIPGHKEFRFREVTVEHKKTGKIRKEKGAGVHTVGKDWRKK